MKWVKYLLLHKGRFEILHIYPADPRQVYGLNHVHDTVSTPLILLWYSFPESALLLRLLGNTLLSLSNICLSNMNQPPTSSLLA